MKRKKTLDKTDDISCSRKKPIKYHQSQFQSRKRKLDESHDQTECKISRTYGHHDTTYDIATNTNDDDRLVGIKMTYKSKKSNKTCDPNTLFYHRAEKCIKEFNIVFCLDY